MGIEQEDYTLCCCIVSKDSLLVRALNGMRRAMGWTPLYEKGTPSSAMSLQILSVSRQLGV
jgi:hypothetical protein